MTALFYTVGFMMYICALQHWLLHATTSAFSAQGLPPRKRSVGRPSALLSVGLSHHSPAARLSGGFTAERRTGRRFAWTTAAIAGHTAAAAQRTERMALSSKCEQCHADS